MPVQDGVFNIDKPVGITSHDVVNRLRRLSSIRRIGHAGTLDPLATGVLLVCMGRTTRLVEYLVGQPKRYTAVIRLGQSTNTYDADGEVTAERPFAHLTLDEIETAVATFQGTIQQQPPAYSAIKKDGQPLYKLARQGIEVERPWRTVTLSEIVMRQWQTPFLTLDVRCSTGTYIRSLAHDLGEKLGCGGHITALRRTAVGAFTTETAVPLDALTPENLSAYRHAPETAVAHLPTIMLDDDAMTALFQGKMVPRHVEHPIAEMVQVWDENGRFGGIATARDNDWQPHKLFPPV